MERHYTLSCTYILFWSSLRKGYRFRSSWVRPIKSLGVAPRSLVVRSWEDTVFLRCAQSSAPHWSFDRNSGSTGRRHPWQSIHFSRRQQGFFKSLFLAAFVGRGEMEWKEEQDKGSLTNATEVCLSVACGVSL